MSRVGVYSRVGAYSRGALNRSIAVSFEKGPTPTVGVKIKDNSIQNNRATLVSLAVSLSKISIYSDFSQKKVLILETRVLRTYGFCEVISNTELCFNMQNRKKYVKPYLGKKPKYGKKLKI